ncbi:MAG: hypothetical protein ABSE62_00595 [Chthoniobacteraceae bacterium]
MKPTRAALLGARFAGLLALGWVYFASFDLRWLLRAHRIQSQIIHAPFQFAYYPYLALNIANLAAAIIAVCVLIAFPSWLLARMTPASRAAHPLNAGWSGVGVALGFILLLLGVYEILATMILTVFESGGNSGWQTELLVDAAIAAAGVVVCRQVLARRKES